SHLGLRGDLCNAMSSPRNAVLGHYGSSRAGPIGPPVSKPAAHFLTQRPSARCVVSGKHPMAPCVSPAWRPSTPQGHLEMAVHAAAPSLFRALVAAGDGP